MHKQIPFRCLAGIILLAACLPVHAQYSGGMLPSGSMTSGYSGASSIGQPYLGSAQPYSGSSPSYGGIGTPYYVQMEEPFDYRFDRQYNSTVKPYLRWYFRQSPEEQQKYYHRFRQMYGYRIYRIPCRGNCGIHYRQVVIDMMPDIPRRRYNAALDFNAPAPIDDDDDTDNKPTPKLDYSPFDDRTQERERLRDYDGDNTFRPQSLDGATGDVRARTVWISRDAGTGSQSVLYKEPTAASASNFYRGIAQVGKAGQILHVRWSQTPPWATENQVAEN